MTGCSTCNTSFKMLLFMTVFFNLSNIVVLFCNVSYAGKEWPEKICEVRKKMNEKKAIGLVVTALDEIAWLLNLRGSDISYNPVFFAYIIVTTDSVMFVCYTLCFILMKTFMPSPIWTGWTHNILHLSIRSFVHNFENE